MEHFKNKITMLMDVVKATITLLIVIFGWMIIIILMLDMNYDDIINIKQTYMNFFMNIYELLF